jgi:hypothetical protein
MNIENVRRGTVLITDDPIVRLENNMASAIQVIEVTEQGFRVRRMNLYYNGETFFLTRQALEQSHWTYAPLNSQLRFM